MQVEEWLEKHLDALEVEELAAVDWHNSCRGMSLIGGFIFGMAIQAFIANRTRLFDNVRAGTKIGKVSYAVVMVIPMVSAVLIGGYFRSRQVTYLQHLMDKYSKSLEP